MKRYDHPRTGFAAATDRASPAKALERAFGSVLRERMQDMPMVNPALVVEAIGFRPWGEHWLGILITPWFMNLVLMPRVDAKWRPIGERETRHYVFPAGVFEFIGGRDPTLGDYQACSLFSPVFGFTAQQEARDTALAALEALFDPAQREAGETTVPAPAPNAASGLEPPTPAPRLLSKRDLLFGLSPRATRGP